MKVIISRLQSGLTLRSFIRSGFVFQPNDALNGCLQDGQTYRCCSPTALQTSCSQVDPWTTRKLGSCAVGTSQWCLITSFVGWRKHRSGDYSGFSCVAPLCSDLQTRKVLLLKAKMIWEPTAWFLFATVLHLCVGLLQIDPFHFLTTKRRPVKSRQQQKRKTPQLFKKAFFRRAIIRLPSSFWVIWK